MARRPLRTNTLAEPVVGGPPEPFFVNMRQMLKAQQMEAEEAKPTLTLTQLKEELLLAIYEKKRAELTAKGHDFFHYFEPPQGVIEMPDGRRLEVQCPKHKTKNTMQVLSRQKTAGLLDLQKIIATARLLHEEDSKNFTLVAAFLRNTDMQDSAALAHPLISQQFQAELALNESTANESTFLSAVGDGHIALDMPGLPMVERVRLLEVVRQNALLNAMGDAIFFPFGGGVARQRAGEPLGVRSASFNGLAGTNMRAMLQASDVLASLREGNPTAIFETLNLKLMNTDRIEFSFSVLKKLGGYYKGELEQAKQTFRRADHLESVSHD